MSVVRATAVGYSATAGFLGGGGSSVNGGSLGDRLLSGGRLLSSSIDVGDELLNDSLLGVGLAVSTTGCSGALCLNRLCKFHLIKYLEKVNFCEILGVSK